MGYQYDCAEAEDDFGDNKSRAMREPVRPAPIEDASDKLDAIYAIMTDGDAPDITDLESAVMLDPLNMARRYAAILGILTGGRS